MAHSVGIWVDDSYSYYSVKADAYETETRSYNAMGQMTQQAWAAEPVTDAWGGPYTNPYAFAKTLKYDFPDAGVNNGQLASMTTAESSAPTAPGEKVTYSYDALKRLTQVSGVAVNGGGTASWTETYGMDGFGNLTSKSLTGAIPVDGATNRLTSASYDLNGNMTSGAGATLEYDVANRLKKVSPTSGGTEYYGYAPDNKRVFRVKPDGSEEWTLFGIGGEKIGTYVTSGPQAVYNNQGNWTGQTAAFAAVKVNVWFDGRLVTEGGGAVYQDRLGTNRASGARFRPYGDEINTPKTAEDRVKFGTYTRDSFSGLDYADQRFYASTYGRFNTADPSTANVDRSNPASMNLYSYVNGDPGNLNDPSGLQACAPSDPTCAPSDTFDQWGGDNNWDNERPWSLWSPNTWIQDPTGSGFLSNGYGAIAVPLANLGPPGAAWLALCSATPGCLPTLVAGGVVVAGVGAAIWYILRTPPPIQAGADLRQNRNAGRSVSREPGCRSPEPGDFDRVHEIIKDMKGPDGKVSWETLLEAWREILCK